MKNKCDECKRPVWLGGDPMRFNKAKYAEPAADFGASHFFCDDCLTQLELDQSVLLGEIESIEALAL